MGCVAQIFFEVDDNDSDRRPRFNIIETQLPDFQDLVTMIEADRLITGDVLWTHRSEETTLHVIHRRQPIAFRGSSVKRVLATDYQYTDLPSAQAPIGGH